MKKTVLKSFTILCVLSMVLLVALASNIHPVEASGTIYIRATGEVEGTDKIQRDGDVYTFTANIFDEIVVERDGIVVDGAGYTLQGTGSGTGISLLGRSNVIIRNMEIKTFNQGISLDGSSSIKISNNNVTNNISGIGLTDSSNNIISENNIAQNTATYGIALWGFSSYNIISGNDITQNNMDGIRLYNSSNNTISGNNITQNNYGGIRIRYESSNNDIYHNNFIDNTQQVIFETSWEYTNSWDDGYPSGGNYWSDYTGVDEKSGPNQDQPGSDCMGDTLYTIYANNRDNYPLMSPSTPSPIEHELATSIRAPTSLPLGISLSFNATVTNQGTSDETNVELVLLVNGTIVDSTIISILQAGDLYTLSYLWTPTAKGTYNVTAYAHPVPGETFIENNQNAKFTTVWPIGVKAGDWIKYAYSYRESPETPYTEWIKVEFLSVEGTTVTIRGTIHLSDGTEQNETFTVDIADHMSLSHAPVFDTLSGFVILANSTVGYMAWIGMTDGKPCARIKPPPHLFTCCGSGIEGETERTYAGTSRTVVYAKYSTYVIEYGPLTCYWDRQTGVLVEVCNTRSDGWTAKAAETNMWKTSPSQPSEETLGAYNTIESLPSGSVAILSFDFGPSTVSENKPQAKAFLSHCRRRGLRVVALAFWASGGALAHDIITEVYGEEFENSVEYGESIVYLGYVPGAEIGMQTFGDNTWDAKGTDHYGTAVANLSLMQEVRSAEDFDLWIELTSGTPGEQQVIQFVQGRHQGENPDWPETGYMPLVVGATAVSVPGMMPFYEADQIVGMLNGLAGANEYEWLLSLHAFDVILDDVNYPVLVQSNSTVSDFVFSQAEHGISFNVAGALGTIGYCNITIPKSLLWGNYTVYVNGTEIPYTTTNNSTHTFLHFTYDLSTKAVFIHATDVIPEFPSALIVPLLMALTLVVAVLLKKRRLYMEKDSELT